MEFMVTSSLARIGDAWRASFGTNESVNPNFQSLVVQRRTFKQAGWDTRKQSKLLITR
jgi:hypothetical protein